MSQSQLPLALADQPKERRESVLVAFHNSGGLPIPAAELKARDRKASAQELHVLATFARLRPVERRLTPSEVWRLIDADSYGAPMLLTSVRRAMTNLAEPKRYPGGPTPLLHHPEDLRPSPRGGTESTWSLNQPTTTSTRGDRSVTVGAQGGRQDGIE